MDEQLKRIHGFVDSVKTHAVSRETGEVNWPLVRAMLERFVVLECLEALKRTWGSAPLASEGSQE